jgi:signal transduction histidine kinase
VVEDTGPGIPQAVRQRLFEPGARGHDDASAGSGLGLSIVKRVAEHLRWSIRLDDAPHGGSRFTLTFASLAAEA